MMLHQTRIQDHERIGAALAGLSELQLLHLLQQQAKPLGAGIGGSARLMRVDGRLVFAKLIPLCEQEADPAQFRSTANLFKLPPQLQYGVGSPGFGAWRELAANEQTSAWVRSGRCTSFALMHHWRVLPMRDAAALPQTDEIESAVAFWHGDAALRARLQALAEARASLVLFMEYVPQTLADWLPQQAAAGRLDQACAMVERELLAAVRCMGEHGMLHFDAHFRNILTDGEQLYLADLGLASSRQFQLSAAEREFHEQHGQHDRAYVVTQLVNALVKLVAEAGSVEQRAGLLRSCAEGAAPAAAPALAADLLRRHAATALVMNGFYGALYGESRLSLYPADAIRQCLTPPSASAPAAPPGRPR